MLVTFYINTYKQIHKRCLNSKYANYTSQVQQLQVRVDLGVIAIKL